MTERKRIALNVMATYGRSLYALAIGLFTGRWTLMALGEVDYGLMGVVGGLSAFISFLNGKLADATNRFYSYSLGEAKNDPYGGLENCRRWFSLAVTIHTIVPLILIIVGYPVGLWMVRHFLVIPVDRIEACVWIFRFVCVSCIVGMVVVPYNAMYTARQYIAELTVYSFATTTLNFFFLCYVAYHPQDWLVWICAWGCILSVVPNVLIALRATKLFPECKFSLKYCWDARRACQLITYVGWNMIGGLAWLFRGQGMSILVNKFFGPAINAAFQISNTVSGQSTSLADALSGALTPAITTAYGAGEYEKMRRMSYQACKFGLISMLLFLLPLSVELPTVLNLWLKNPPKYSSTLCWFVMLMLLAHQSAFGHIIAVSASGKVALYQTVNGIILLLALPCAWFLAKLGMGVYSVGFALALTMGVCALGRVVIARFKVGMSIRHWLFKILLPVSFVSAICFLISLLPRIFMASGCMRVIMSTVICELLFLPFSWLIVLDASERIYLQNKFEALRRRLR